MSGAVFESPGMRKALARVGYLALPELKLEKIASRRVIEPMVASSRYPVNSDYFPVVDQNAAKARFLKLSAHDIANVPKSFVPFSALVDGDTRIRVSELDSSKEIGSTRITEALVAAALVELVGSGGSAHAARVDPTRRLQAAVVREGMERCTQDPGLWLDAVEDVLRMVVPVLRGPEVDGIFTRLSGSACFRSLDAKGRDRLALYAAFHARDAGAMVAVADRLLATGHPWSRPDRATFVLAAMSGRVVRGDLDGARRLWEAQRAAIPDSTAKQLHFRVVLSHLLRQGETGDAGEEAAHGGRESATAAPGK